MVSKRAIDALRDHLIQEGHTGIPTNNERIFDVLQEHNVIVSNGDRAIWTAEIAGDNWSHTFTLLRFRAGLIWTDISQRPEAFAGTVKVTSDESKIEKLTSLQPLPPAQVVNQEITIQENVEPDISPESTPIEISSAGAPPPKKDSDLSSLGEEFLNWVIEGVQSKHLRINQADARLHVVPEGLLLVSPRIFKDYAKAINQPNGWSRVQSAFCAIGLHQRCENDDSNIHHYKVELIDGNYSGSTPPTLKGIVLIDPTIVFKTANYQPNPILHRVIKLQS
jgi:hypothetical protein